MHLPLHIDLRQYPVRVRWTMGFAWLLIALKCIVVTWAIDRYQVPIHAGWIVAPTLMFAALATTVWLTHRRA